MNCRNILGLLLVLAIPAGCATRQPAPGWTEGHWVDLTHAFSGQTVYWPNADRFRLETVFDGTTTKGYHYSANRYTAAEHGGTHMDAPIHFAAGGQTVEHVPLDRIIGPTLVIDVEAAARANRDYLIGPADFARWEQVHGRIPERSIILLRTGYDRYWPDARRYLGTDERGEAAIARLHFPGLAPAGARWLVEQRGIRAVGLDTASIDYGQSSLFESHRILAARGIPIFENLAALDRLPATGAWLVALPMKIEGGSGAPLRAVAWLPQ
ncbi:cyclase family protein [Methyloparacoccus murrellii]